MRLIRDIKTHIRRSPYQAIAAVLTMFLTFLVGGVFFLATTTSIVILRYFESKPQITVFFTSKVADTEIQNLKTKLEGTGRVASMKFVSKEQALSIYQEQNKSDPLLLEMVTADILPSSLEVSANDPNELSALVDVIKGSEGVDEVVYQKDVVDSLLVWTNAIRVVGGTLALLLIIDSLLIIGTVIAMKIALKRDEIEILTLVGASPWFIRAPFIIEGGVYGLFGAGLAAGVLSGLVLWARPFLFTFLGSVPVISSVLSNPTGTYFLLSMGIFWVGTLMIGFLLGAMGSYIALIRFLRS